MTETNTARRRAINDVRSVLTAAAVICIVGQLSSLCADEQHIDVSQVTISLVREADIPARDAGTLAEVNFSEGQSVTRNQVVAVLENQQQMLKLNASELNLDVARLRAADSFLLQAATAQVKESFSSRRLPI
ncbi:MAG: hypothetical protein GY758_02690, partial [Fuerstiella sp.]|nr:hypothetical protein [Fuerstiella sp.]